MCWPNPSARCACWRPAATSTTRCSTSRRPTCGATLSPVEKRTFCPLKGHASYFDLVSDDGGVEAPEIAWSHRETLDCAAALKDLVAFDAARVVIEEHPRAAGTAS